MLSRETVALLILTGNFWSGRRGSNPRPRPWQGRALPLSYTRVHVGHNQRPSFMAQAAAECNTLSRGYPPFAFSGRGAPRRFKEAPRGPPAPNRSAICAVGVSASAAWTIRPFRSPSRNLAAKRSALIARRRSGRGSHRRPEAKPNRPADPETKRDPARPPSPGNAERDILGPSRSARRRRTGELAVRRTQITGGTLCGSRQSQARTYAGSKDIARRKHHFSR